MVKTLWKWIFKFSNCPPELRDDFLDQEINDFFTMLPSTRGLLEHMNVSTEVDQGLNLPGAKQIASTEPGGQVGPAIGIKD